MSEQVQDLIGQLCDFRRRKAAMAALVRMGDAAVPDLVDALAHPMENARWAARSVLVSIGSAQATAALTAVLDDAERGEAAREALREITGQAPPAGGPAAASLSDEALVQAAVAGTDVTVASRSGGAVLTVPLKEGRQQRVTVSFTATDGDDHPLVVAYTECGPAEAKNHEWALRQNLRMAFGAIAIRDRDGQPVFVMVNTHLRAACAPEELRKTVLLLARKGDKLEKALTTEDER
ncbi:HEAT repeat domain-containing protein [bacterium]|nr:HEAT repeat domain-containing protein [bacterium]